MECAICYEKFFTPKTQEEFQKRYEDIVKNNTEDGISKFLNYLISDKHNTTYKCPTLNCEGIVCLDCYISIQINDKINNEYEEDNEYNDIPSNKSKFRCPYCRNIDWKGYMNNVFNELQMKVLGEEEFEKILFKKCFPEFDT
jgi:hypothetical protein